MRRMRRRRGRRRKKWNRSFLPHPLVAHIFGDSIRKRFLSEPTPAMRNLTGKRVILREGKHKGNMTRDETKDKGAKQRGVGA